MFAVPDNSDYNTIEGVWPSVPGSKAARNGFLAVSDDNRHHHNKDNKLTWVAGVDSIREKMNLGSFVM